MYYCITETYFPLWNSLSLPLSISLSPSVFRRFFMGLLEIECCGPLINETELLFPITYFAFCSFEHTSKNWIPQKMDVWARENWRESQRDRVKTRDGEKMDGGWHYNKDDGVCIYVSKKIAWIPFGSLQFHAFSVALSLFHLLTTARFDAAISIAIVHKIHNVLNAFVLSICVWMCMCLCAIYCYVSKPSYVVEWTRCDRGY